jgi:hypothetical protein
MPCPEDDFTGTRTEGLEFQNWLGNVKTSVQTYFEPDSLKSLVWVLQEAIRKGRKVRPVGSGWSFEDIAACPDFMLDLSLHLKRFITDVIGVATDGVPNALTPEWQRRINRDGSDVRLVHVEAGITLFELNQQLWRNHHWAMPSLGGSQGQTLAGAISTSTHGGDPSQPPLPDLVKAVHLVTHNGQEMWVESSSEPLTTERFLRPRFSCADIQIIQDDELLRALQVSVGRFGIVYAYVLQVRREFSLVEWANPMPWSQVAGLLREEGGSLGPLQNALPEPHFDRMRIDRELGISRGPQLRHFELLMNSRSPNQLWVRRRLELEFAIAPETGGEGGGPELFELPTVANWVLQAAAAAIRSIIPMIAWIPVYGASRTVELSARAGELDFMALDPHMTANRAMVASLNAIWASDDWGLFNDLINSLTEMVFDGRPELAKDGKLGVSWQIMAGTSPDPGNTKVNSIEVIFDGRDMNYVDFIDFLASECRNYRQAGYISIRYSRKSDALLSMHNVESNLAVSIEVASIEGFEHNQRWMRAIESRAIELGGRPHWGQHNTLHAHQVNRLYGHKVNRWRDQLARVAGMTGTFSNNYTEQRGLEPGRVERLVTAVRRAGGRITHLCNPGQYWSPMGVAEFTEAFDAEHVLRVGRAAFAPRGGSINYYVQPADASIPRVPIVVEHVLTTSPDENRRNNLSALPDAREAYIHFPPPESTRRRVTSVVRNRWRGVIALCNDEEHWRIPDEIAFHEIASGRVEYFVERPLGSEPVLLQARSYVATFADGVEGNNLGDLPEEES